MPSGSTRGHAFLLNKKTCLHVQPEDKSSCSTGRHVFLFNKRTCLLAQQENLSSCSTRRHVFLFKKTCLLVEHVWLKSGRYTSNGHFHIGKLHRFPTRIQWTHSCSVKFSKSAGSHSNLELGPRFEPQGRYDILMPERLF